MTSPLTLLGLTTFAKLAFGIFFTAGATLHHKDQFLTAIEFCQKIGNDDYYYGPDFLFCYFDFTRGLLTTGAIFFFISILLEAFGPNKILTGSTTVPTIFNGIGSLFLIVSSMYQILVNNEGLYELYYDHPDFQAGFWIAGGLITCLGQAYLAFVLRSEGLFVVVTYFFAGLGSLMFMVEGIMKLERVREDYLETHDIPEYVDLAAGLIISGSVFYLVHGILYPIATYNKIKELTTNQENHAVTVANPNIDHNEKEKPNNLRDVEEC